MSPHVDQVHRRTQERLREATAQQLAALLYALPDPTEQDAMATYSSQAARIVAGGQRHSATLAMAYVGQYAARARGGGLLVPTPERALAGVLVSPESPVARSPVLRLWGVVGEGAPLDEARRQAASYAEGLSSGDLQAAERGGLDEAARATGKRIKGWRKVLSSSPCEWCRTIASDESGRYHAADSVPFHQRDGCGVAPVFYDD